MDNADLFNIALRSSPRTPEDADCERICQVAEDRFGFGMTPDQARLIWEEYSESMAAGWMQLGDDDRIASEIRSFVRCRTGKELL